MFIRIISIAKARMREFYRDRASLGWNFAFPFFIIIGFYFIFSEENRTMFKVGHVGPVNKQEISLFKLKYINFVELTREKGIEAVRKHKVDMLISQTDTIQYWINSSSTKGYFLEELLNGSKDVRTEKQIVVGKEISYVDWVFPGVLAMNVMFSCLWGVGYSIVKYRQDGYLKRLKVTPLRAYEFLISQIFSRYLISVFVTSIVFFGCKYLIGFEMQGSYLDLFLIYSLGLVCLISVGLLVASYTTSKEFANGVLNIVTWPMMFLSGVWFSLEGSSEGVKFVSSLFPLTHLVSASRRIMTEGVGFQEVLPNAITLGVMALVFITLSSYLFKWNAE